jgi:hypothetical protein
LKPARIQTACWQQCHKQTQKEFSLLKTSQYQFLEPKSFEIIRGVMTVQLDYFRYKIQTAVQMRCKIAVPKIYGIPLCPTISTKPTCSVAFYFELQRSTVTS